MVLDLTSLLGQIEGAFAAGLDVESIERTLTDGYAYALALESERWRLEQRMSELAGELTEGNQELKSRELALLSDRLAKNAGLLSGLRNELQRLRARTSAARRAG